MSGQVCPFHADEWIRGDKLEDSSFSYTCHRRGRHPADGPWSWLVMPEPPSVAGLAGLAEELNLAEELPAALTALGEGWFEYGLVERTYALRRPDDFARMVAQWGHTSIAPTNYSVSSYLAGTLGRLSKSGVVAFHWGPATGRWSYNAGISWWSSLPPLDWSHRTSWVQVVGDSTPEDRARNLACRAYVPGAEAVKGS